MKIKDYILTTEENDTVEYIYHRLKEGCPNVVYIPRPTVLCIGEMTRHFMVYFAYNGEIVQAKFKDCELIPLLSNKKDIDALIDSTVVLFKKNAFLLKEPPMLQVRHKPSNVISVSEKVEFEIDCDIKAEYQVALERVNDSVEVLSHCSLRLSNCLSKCGIITVGDLKNLNVTQVLKIRYFGRKCFQELITVLKSLGDGNREEKEVSEDSKENNIYLLDYCSVRLKNCLLSRGITTTDDLKNYTTEELFKIRNFGMKCYRELLSVIVMLGVGGEDNKIDKIISKLSAPVTSYSMLKAYNNDVNVVNYLKSIEFDEQRFTEGTAGYLLCLKKKAENYNFDFTLDFSDVALIYKQYVDNADYFDIYYLQIIDYIKQIANIRLDKREERIYFARLGLKGKVMTLEEIGKEECVSRERIRQILVKIEKKLNHPSSLSLIIPNYERIKLIEQIKKVSLEAFIVYLIYRENFTFLHRFFCEKFLRRNITNKLNIKEILNYEKLVFSRQEFNSKVFGLITTFNKNTRVSDEAWGRLQPQRCVGKHEDSLSGIYAYNGREYQYESNEELRCLQRLLQNNTFKDIKTQSLAIDYGDNHKYYPDFQCLTHDNRFVIIEVKPAMKMCEYQNLQKFKALKQYCERYGFGYLIIDSAFRSFEEVAIENSEFNERIIANLPLRGYNGLRVYQTIYRETDAKIYNLLWLVTHSDVRFSIPFSLKRDGD